MNPVFLLPLTYSCPSLKECKVKSRWRIFWRPKKDCFYIGGWRRVTLKRSYNLKCAPRPKYTQTPAKHGLRLFLIGRCSNLEMRHIRLHAGFHSCFLFCWYTHFSGIYEPPCSLCGYCTLSLHSLPPPCATTHQQMGAFQSCRVSCCLLQIHQTKHYSFFLSLTEDQLETFNAAPVTPCEQMCLGCKWAKWRGGLLYFCNASGTFGWERCSIANDGPR